VNVCVPGKRVSNVMSKQVTLSNGVAVQKNRKPMASILLFMLNFGARYDSPVFFHKVNIGDHFL